MDGEDHAQLWRDILSQYELLLPVPAAPAGTTGHFIGSFVLAPTPAPASLPAFLVVDGQQRLTTLTLALCALREAAAVQDPRAFERITNQYLVNQYGTGDERWKFVPTEQDKKPYFACLEGRHAGVGKNQSPETYGDLELLHGLPTGGQGRVRLCSLPCLRVPTAGTF